MVVPTEVATVNSLEKKESIKKEKKPRVKKEKIVEKPKVETPAYRLNYLCFTNEGIPVHEIRLCSIIIPDLPDEEFENTEEPKKDGKKIKDKRLEAWDEYDSDSDARRKKRKPLSADASKQLKLRMEAKNEAKRKEREIEMETFLNEWMHNEEQSKEGLLPDETIDQIARRVLNGGDWPSYFVTCEELKERFYSIQRSLLVLYLNLFLFITAFTF